MESHRNYNTPEEMKKRGGPANNFVIPDSIVNVGNPGERFDGSTEHIKQRDEEELKEGGEMQLIKPNYLQKRGNAIQAEDSDEFDDLVSFDVPSEYLNKSTCEAKQY
mmetsp:Transcript_15861/g.21485  ORF Transcript_15861/g.21485 Transcript_15861/m.21485 type:complete len:107 (+) Transcript_15861:1366-1686(+)|eukprot:CAMPEP_0170465498 /NCGR_PEP_ID=MMETSP0123-20130129/9819_1 /TAXON_ID=182087 /ORGANISM="Favella ehrenbergii, Strain Fehren 1" /LENGTH=106 /DNA_ID=CAMNT_0010731409 /DNA_START=1286 /DNA_END=1606 /DNA_ORIENTATION=-